jgi:hypothetical protein
MSTRASRGAAAATLIAAAVVGFGGGALTGTAAGGEDPSTDNGAGTSPPSSTQSPSDTPDPAGAISLSAAKATFAANDKIDLTGALDPAAGGVELKVERSLNGSDWDSFPDAGNQVTVTTRDDGTFSTYVQTGREGENQFRVVGQVGENFLESEPVVVTIG